MADTRPVTPALQTASTLRVTAQFEAARANFVAKFPTQAPRMPPFTWQANSDSPSRGAGQVRMMALMSSPMPTAETKASTKTDVRFCQHNIHCRTWFYYFKRNESKNSEIHKSRCLGSRAQRFSSIHCHDGRASKTLNEHSCFSASTVGSLQVDQICIQRACAVVVVCLSGRVDM